MKIKPRIFSGMQPTGLLHIGNWLGALKNWVELQEKYESIFSIVDLHAMSIPYSPKEMRRNILELALDYLSCGLDPKKSIIFVQSHVPEHTELAWILNTITPLGKLQRMTQFKEKAKEHPKDINVGLLDYPVLQAADILLYKATLVPVGEDQKQHIELSREISRRFNERFGQVFPEPQALISRGARIMALDDPKKKMSKSLGQTSYIALSDSPELIWQKLSKAVTDPARQRRGDPGNPKKCNLYGLHELFSSQEEVSKIKKACREASWGCLECKKILAQNICRELAPIQKRRKILEKNPISVKSILAQGAERARRIARETMKEVKKKTGLS